MNKQMSRKGFTLIELLVIVLIIAILASIALPQYQFVVKRSQWAIVPVLFKKAMQAQQYYYLQHGHYATTWNQLDGYEDWSGTSGLQALSPDGKFYCQLFGGSLTNPPTHAKCWPKGYSEYNFSLAQYFGGKTAYCWNSKKLQARICRSWGATNCPIQDSARGCCTFKSPWEYKNAPV